MDGAPGNGEKGSQDLSVVGSSTVSVQSPSTQHTPVVRNTSHYWVVSSRFLNTSILIAASPVERGTARLSFVDCDGKIFNEASIELSPGRIGVFELEPFMAEVKLESGFRHAHLVLETGRGVLSSCHLHTSEGATIIGKADSLTSHRPVFSPLRTSEALAAYVAIINEGEEEAEVRVRLFLGKRSPESLIMVPGNGCRIISVRDEFSEFFGEGEKASLQGYIRLTTRADKPLGFQILERHLGSNGGNVFCTLS